MGLTLFLTYINNRCNLDIGEGGNVSFANDTALLFRGNSWKDAYSEAQNGFSKVSNCLSTNKLI